MLDYAITFRRALINFAIIGLAAVMLLSHGTILAQTGQGGQNNGSKNSGKSKRGHKGGGKVEKGQK